MRFLDVCKLHCHVERHICKNQKIHRLICTVYAKKKKNDRWLTLERWWLPLLIIQMSGCWLSSCNLVNLMWGFLLYMHFLTTITLVWFLIGATVEGAKKVRQFLILNPSMDHSNVLRIHRLLNLAEFSFLVFAVWTVSIFLFRRPEFTHLLTLQEGNCWRIQKFKTQKRSEFGITYFLIS